MKTKISIMKWITQMKMKVKKDLKTMPSLQTLMISKNPNHSCHE